MALSSKQRSELKGKAHHLKPVVRIGQHGLSDAVINEADQSLNTHGLIKVHIQHDERDTRRQIAAELCEKTQAELVGSIGKIAILYRPQDEK